MVDNKNDSPKINAYVHKRNASRSFEIDIEDLSNKKQQEHQINIRSGGGGSLPSIPVFNVNKIDNNDCTFENLQPLFSNPALESFMRAQGTLYRSRKKNAKTRKGFLEVSFRSLHFSSIDNNYVVTLPFIDVNRISKKPPNTIKIVLKAEGSKNIYIVLERDDMASMLSQLHKASVGEEDSTQFLTVTPHDSLWKEKQTFFESYFDPQAEKALYGHWENYFNYFGSGSTMIRTRALFDLLLNGIPNSLRRKRLLL